MLKSKSHNWNWFSRGENRKYVNGVLVSKVPNDTQLQDSLNSTCEDHGPDWRVRLKRDPVFTGYLSSIWSILRFVGEPLFEVIGKLTNLSVVRYTGTSIGAIPSTGSKDMSLLEKARSQAIAKLLARYHEKTRSVQGLVLLGEMRETAHLISSPARGISAILAAYHKRVRPSVKVLLSPRRPGVSRNSYAKQLNKARNRISNAWLVASFGLSPLLGEAQRAYDFYHRVNNSKDSEFIPIRAKGKSENANPTTIQTQQMNEFAFLRYVRLRSWECNVKYRTAISARRPVGPDGIPHVEFGTSVRDFVPTVWELIPYSFFVDYFTNVGQILDAWAFCDVFPRGVQETVVHIAKEVISGYQIHPIPNNPNTLLSGTISDATFEARTTWVERQLLTALPIPSLSVSTGISGRQFANIAALASNRFNIYSRLLR